MGERINLVPQEAFKHHCLDLTGVSFANVGEELGVPVQSVSITSRPSINPAVETLKIRFAEIIDFNVYFGISCVAKNDRDGVVMGFSVSAKKLWAEFIDTYYLLFAGTGAIIINEMSGGAVTHVGIALAYGLIVFSMIAALLAGPVSGESMNPARSFAPAIVSWQLAELWIYLVGPLLGATLAVLACRCSHEPGCCRIPVREE